MDQGLYISYQHLKGHTTFLCTENNTVQGHTNAFFFPFLNPGVHTNAFELL